MNILGISAFYHDAAAALVCNGDILAAVQEERFTRKKNDPSFPINAIKYCLSQSNLRLNDLDAVAFYDKPFLKFERLIETYYAFSPKGITSFIKAMPVWLKEKLFLKSIIYKHLKEIGDFDKKKLKLLFPEHHLSHAASAFYPSPFEASAILTIDGVGEWASATICRGERAGIEVIKELHFPHSVGLLYSSFTYYCGFKVNSGEYKLMGLAPYGNKHAARCQRFVDLIKTVLVDIKEDGSIFLNQQYFNYATGLHMVNREKWERLFGIKRREPEADLDPAYCDLALAIQTVTEEIVLKMVREAKRLTESENLCIAGGVALNCVANAKIFKDGLFENIFIQPAAGDAGGALGAAYAAHYLYFNQPRNNVTYPDSLHGSFLGPAFSDLEISTALATFDPHYTQYQELTELTAVTADLLAQGNVVGWFQGRMEFGPRALGARSILADPRDPEMQRRLNLKIKFREDFRPFAPAVLAEDQQNYFEEVEASPYMLTVKHVKVEENNESSTGLPDLPSPGGSYFKRGELPATTHVDLSARVQTVHKETNLLFWLLLEAFKKRTGCSVLTNTSFNVRGEPIVNTPVDAYLCFMQTDMDCLVMGNLIFDKKKQPVLDSRYFHNKPFEAD